MPRRAVTQENTNTAETMEQQVPFEVTITEHNPERGVLATADVKVGNMMTIRNVKIKEDDYGLTVTIRSFLNIQKLLRSAEQRRKHPLTNNSHNAEVCRYQISAFLNRRDNHADI